MIKLDKSVSSIVIIGCGGVTSWLVAPLVKLLNSSEHRPDLVLVDGDTIEERNLDRQWFDESDIGQNKAVAMHNKNMPDYSGTILIVENYFSDGTQLPVGGMKLFLGCADNHAARRAMLSTVDREGGWAIIAGNEYVEAEAYYYEPRLKETQADPRLFYPFIMTDFTGDPMAPQGCTGLAAIASPQLVLANFSAANHLLWLLYHHFVEKPGMGSDYKKEFIPIRTWNLGTRYQTTRLCDFVTGK